MRQTMPIRKDYKQKYVHRISQIKCWALFIPISVRYGSYKFELDHNLNELEKTTSKPRIQENTMPKIQCEYCEKWVKSQRGLDQHLRQSQYCLKLQEEIDKSANVRHDLKESGNDEPQIKKKTCHLDTETKETHIKEDERVAKIGRASHMDSVHLSTSTECSATENSCARTQKHYGEIRQLAKNSMDWLPYSCPIGHEVDSMFATHSNSSSDEDD
jgi:hypothetical protein